jgi:quercetin dioxygenase-like cupin family protein
MNAVLRRAAALSALLTVGLAVPAEAGATPPRGITGVILARVTIGGTDYVLREITIAPGGSTGWHYHDGPVYGIVRQGAISHYDATCRPDKEGGPGTVIVERAGGGYVHLERNEGTGPQVLDVLYTLPTGSPLAENVPNPGCPLN